MVGHVGSRSRSRLFALFALLFGSHNTSSSARHV